MKIWVEQKILGRDFPQNFREGGRGRKPEPRLSPAIRAPALLLLAFNLRAQATEAAQTREQEVRQPLPKVLSALNAVVAL